MKWLVNLTCLAVLVFSLWACNTDGKQPNNSTSSTAIAGKNPKLPKIPPLDNRGLSKEEAINLAREFVIIQGYTNQKASLSLEEIKFEDGSYASDAKHLLDYRYNTLHAKPMGAKQYGEKQKWAIGFVPVINEENIVRVVTMDTMGGNMKLDTVNVRGDWLLR